MIQTNNVLQRNTVSEGSTSVNPYSYQPATYQLRYLISKQKLDSMPNALQKEFCRNHLSLSLFLPYFYINSNTSPNTSSSYFVASGENNIEMYCDKPPKRSGWTFSWWSWRQEETKRRVKTFEWIEYRVASNFLEHYSRILVCIHACASANARASIYLVM